MKSESSGASPSRGRSWLRRLYDWTLSWAEHPGGMWALFVIALLESSVFPVPPDVLLIALAVGAAGKAFRFAAICTLGSLIGGVIGYAIGLWGYELIGEPIVEFYHGEELMARIQAWYQAYGFWGTLAAAVTPIPYKVFTISSGLFQFAFAEFLLASVIGRSLRFFLVAGVIYWFGPSVKVWIEHYFDYVAWGFLALLVIGVVMIKFL